MRRAIAVSLVLLLVCGSALADGISGEYAYVKHRPEWGLKLGAAFLGEVVTFSVVTTAALAMAPSSVEDPGIWTCLLVGCAADLLLIPAGCTIGAAAVGRHYDEDGKGWASYLGGFVGTTGALTLAFVDLQAFGDSPVGITLYVVSAALPAVGATVGYNLSCSPMESREFKGSRIAPPTLTLTRSLQPDGTRITGISLRLFSLGL